MSDCPHPVSYRILQQNSSDMDDTPQFTSYIYSLMALPMPEILLSSVFIIIILSPTSGKEQAKTV